MRTIKVKKANLYKEDDKWYINATYFYEDDRYKKEINIPKIHIPLEQFEGDVDMTYSDTPFRRNPCLVEYQARFGNLIMPLELADVGLKGQEPVPYTEKIIEEKTQEMTIDEIEKKLGYKIKIVNKK